MYFDSSANQYEITDLEWSVFEATNTLRTQPKYYVPILTERLNHFVKNVYYEPGSNIGIIT